MTRTSGDSNTQGVLGQRREIKASRVKNKAIEAIELFIRVSSVLPAKGLIFQLIAQLSHGSQYSGVVAVWQNINDADHFVQAVDRCRPASSKTPSVLLECHLIYPRNLPVFDHRIDHSAYISRMVVRHFSVASLANLHIDLATSRVFCAVGIHRCGLARGYPHLTRP